MFPVVSISAFLRHPPTELVNTAADIQRCREAKWAEQDVRREEEAARNPNLALYRERSKEAARMRQIRLMRKESEAEMQLLEEDDEEEEEEQEEWQDGAARIVGDQDSPALPKAEGPGFDKGADDVDALEIGEHSRCSRRRDQVDQDDLGSRDCMLLDHGGSLDEEVSEDGRTSRDHQQSDGEEHHEGQEHVYVAEKGVVPEFGAATFTPACAMPLSATIPSVVTWQLPVKVSELRAGVVKKASRERDDCGESSDAWAQHSVQLVVSDEHDAVLQGAATALPSFHGRAARFRGGGISSTGLYISPTTVSSCGGRAGSASANGMYFTRGGYSVNE